MSPRSLYIMGNAAVKIQSIFRGRRAREWVDNQAQRLFPLRQVVSANWHGSGTRDRPIFLQKKSVLLMQARERLRATERQFKEKQEMMVARAEAEFGGEVEAVERFKKRLHDAITSSQEKVDETEATIETYNARIEQLDQSQTALSGEFDRLNSKKNKKARGKYHARRSSEIDLELAHTETEKHDLQSKIASKRADVKLHKIQRRLDEEAIMLHKNMRFIAACIIQEFCKRFVHQKFPHLHGILAEKAETEKAGYKVALTRNQSRNASVLRKELKKRKAVGRFAIIPVIVRMQRDWREYLAITHSKRQISDAYALLKRMREDRISGQEFFNRLKKAHMDEIELAVDFNLKVRQKYITRTFSAWLDYTHDRHQRKAWLHHRVLKRKCAIISEWTHAVIVVEKREFINRVKPNLFPPLLAEYIRYSKDNDWPKFLQALSDLFGEFDEESQICSLEFEEHTTNKVIGFKTFTELNEMLTYHIAQSDMRKKPVMLIGREESLNYGFWGFLHQSSLYVQRGRVSNLMERSRARDLRSDGTKLASELHPWRSARPRCSCWCSAARSLASSLVSTLRGSLPRSLAHSRSSRAGTCGPRRTSRARATRPSLGRRRSACCRTCCTTSS
jgi:hypothetical protein